MQNSRTNKNMRGEIKITYLKKGGGLLNAREKEKSLLRFFIFIFFSFSLCLRQKELRATINVWAAIYTGVEFEESLSEKD